MGHTLPYTWDILEPLFLYSVSACMLMVRNKRITGHFWTGRSHTYLHWTEVAQGDEGVSEHKRSSCHLTRDADYHPAWDIQFPSQHWVQSPSRDNWGSPAGKSSWGYWEDPLSSALRGCECQFCTSSMWFINLWLLWHPQSTSGYCTLFQGYTFTGVRNSSGRRQ